MRNAKPFLHRPIWITLLAIAAAFAFAPRNAAAQQWTSIGPSVDECTGAWVQGSPSDLTGGVFSDICILGDSTQLYAFNQVTTNDGAYYPQVDSDTVMADESFPAPGSFFVDSGYAVEELGEQGGTEAYTGVSTTPNLNDVYTAYFNSAYCYDPSGQGGTGYGDGSNDDCGWNYPNYLSMQGVVTLTGSQGLLYPKAVVLDVVYAPPGANSSVQYQNTNSVGTTSTNSYSFANDIGYTVQTTEGISDSYSPKKGLTLVDGSVSLTDTASSDWIETQNNSSAISVTKQSSLLEGTDGFSTTSPPNGTHPPDLPNDWDQLTLWLNPELVFTAYPAAGGTAGFIAWGGYAWDPGPCSGSNCANYGMDTFRVHVGCLNGDFLNDGNPTNANMCQGEQNILNRAWALGEGLVSPTTGAAVPPAILFNTQDAWNLIYADSLAYNPDPNSEPYTYLSNPYQLPSTTPDGRYTQFCWNGYQPNSSPPSTCPNPLWYEYTDFTQFNLTQMNTQQQSSGGSVGVKSSVSVSSSASAGFLGIFSAKATWTETDTVTQTNTWLDTLSTTQSVVNAFTLKADAPNYATDQIIVYQDNFYGTFMFSPFQ